MHDAEKKLLAGATLMMGVTWEAVKATAQKRGEEQVAKLSDLEEKLRDGKATLAVFVQRDGERVYATAAALPPGFEDPFTGGGLVRVQGPIVGSIEELQRLTVIDPAKFH